MYVGGMYVMDADYGDKGVNGHKGSWVVDI